MSKIATLYIPLIRDFNVLNIEMFRDKFLQRMSKENFKDILRANQIVPEQHRIKYVTEALQLMKSATKQSLPEKRSTSYLSSIDQEIALIERRMKAWKNDRKYWEKRLNEEQTHPDMDAKRRIRIRLCKDRIHSYEKRLKEQERKKSGAELGI